MDRFIGEISKAIKVLSSPATSVRETPGAPPAESLLDPAERRRSSRLMRVNHAGEVAAQALYQGQAFTAGNPRVAKALQHAAAEELDHLAWCERRLRELDGRRSLLNPLWYVGSFAIGALAGALGDGTSLGFIAETEKQVEAHLRSHLERLPKADHRSLSIVRQMTYDEVEHGTRAISLGGEKLPAALRAGMRLTSRLMTGSSYWL